MKLPIAIIFNDSHLKPGNEEETIASVHHMVEYAVSHKIETLMFAGDLFDSRSFQRQSVLHAFDKILKLLYKSGLTTYIFAGNHDKTVYSSQDSFLDIYRHHPGIVLNRDIKNVTIGGIKVTLLPFFSDNVLVPKIEQHEGGDILLSHFEMAGSTILNKVSTKSTINKNMLSKWKKVFLGHYHDYHEITKNIVHLPSLRQANFGEDSRKGFSVIYSDLSYSLIQGKFREFKKIAIDVNKTASKDITKLIQDHRDSKDSIRFEFFGDESKLRAIDRSQFQNTGIDVKVKFEPKYSFEETDLPNFVDSYGESEIRGLFKLFCEEKNYDYSYGREFLDKFLSLKEK